MRFWDGQIILKVQFFLPSLFLFVSFQFKPVPRRPSRRYTPQCITMYYRAPEMILDSKEYGNGVDIWSVGCVLGEILQRKPLFSPDNKHEGNHEIAMLTRIFKAVGNPFDNGWEEYGKLYSSSPTCSKARRTYGEVKLPTSLAKKQSSRRSKASSKVIGIREKFTAGALTVGSHTKLTNPIVVYLFELEHLEHRFVVELLAERNFWLT